MSAGLERPSPRLETGVCAARISDSPLHLKHRTHTIKILSYRCVLSGVRWFSRLPSGKGIEACDPSSTVTDSLEGSAAPFAPFAPSSTLEDLGECGTDPGCNDENASDSFTARDDSEGLTTLRLTLDDDRVPRVPGRTGGVEIGVAMLGPLV